MSRPKPFPLVLILLSLLFAAAAAGRSISDGKSTGTLVISTKTSSPTPSNSSESSCEQTYGFMPCTNSLVGNIFLVLAYGFLMYQGATYLSSGSELLLEVMGPGLVGGLLLPILGALPDALLVLASGLSGNKDTAQSQVLVGMGLLAGSTVMLLTLLWGSCVIVGKCDLTENRVAIDGQDTKGFNLLGSGVSTDVLTSHAAKIMGISVVPFIIAQFPKVLKKPSEQRVAILIALIVSSLLVLSYCLFQVFQPWVQKRRLAFAKHKHVISGILRHVHRQGLGKLLHEDGAPNEAVIRALFKRIDVDKNGTVSPAELRAFIIGVQFEEIDLDSDDAVDKLMDDFDTSGNNILEEDEFVNGIKKWLAEAKHSVSSSGAFSSKFLDDFHNKTRQEHSMLIDKSDEIVETVDNPTWSITKAVLLLVLGTAVAAAFADPLVDAVHGFSQASHIPSFFISFIALPLATNSSEAVSSIIFASRKKQRTSSLTFSEIYGGVTMNNTLCLAVFLAIVYVRHLTWDFSSEVLIILLVCIVMCLLASFRTTYRLWSCLVAFLLYPLSLAIVYVLDNVFGWS